MLCTSKQRFASPYQKYVSVSNEIYVKEAKHWRPRMPAVCVGKLTQEQNKHERFGIRCRRTGGSQCRWMNINGLGCLENVRAQKDRTLRMRKQDLEECRRNHFASKQGVYK